MATILSRPQCVHSIPTGRHACVLRAMVTGKRNGESVIAYGINLSWWRHRMETFSALLGICVGNSPETGEFPTQRPVTRSFDVFFDLCPNERLSKHSWGWWLETQSSPLWRHRNVLSSVLYVGFYTLGYNESMRCISPCSSGFLHWHWDNCPSVCEVTLKKMGRPLSIKPQQTC